MRPKENVKMSSMPTWARTTLGVLESWLEDIKRAKPAGGAKIKPAMIPAATVSATLRTRRCLD